MALAVARHATVDAGVVGAAVGSPGTTVGTGTGAADGTAVGSGHASEPPNSSSYAAMRYLRIHIFPATKSIFGKLKINRPFIIIIKNSTL